MIEDEIVFTAHAEFQLRERGIAKKDVVTCILHPEKIMLQSNGRFLTAITLRKKPKIYLLVAAYEKNNGRVAVITAFITSKTSKYL